MVQIWFPGLTFNGAALVRGQLLDVTLLGVGLVIPPWDITFLPAITFWAPFLIFDSEWITAPISGMLAAIPNAVWGFLNSFLTGKVSEYYKGHHSKEHIERWLGVRRGDPEWVFAQEFDLNNDGIVDSKDVEYFEQQIKQVS